MREERRKEAFTLWVGAKPVLRVQPLFSLALRSGGVPCCLAVLQRLRRRPWPGQSAVSVTVSRYNATHSGKDLPTDNGQRTRVAATTLVVAILGIPP